jgi:hypothetical protein
MQETPDQFLLRIVFGRVYKNDGWPMNLEISDTVSKLTYRLFLGSQATFVPAISHMWDMFL